jgi:hypothetical protein
MRERDGMYPANFGYRLAMTELLHTRYFHLVGGWNRIWKGNALQKVCSLLWRICGGCVPTRIKLQTRPVQCELVCPWCDADVETDCHAFVESKVARESWYWVGLSYAPLQ